jgi:hypothetical protein
MTIGQLFMNRKILNNFIEKYVGAHGLNNVSEHHQTL